MKTQIRKEQGKVLVSLEGKLSFESTEGFKNDLTHLSATSAEQVIFDFSGLEFVGSSGISSFIHILKDFNVNSQTKPLYMNVGTEFKRIINAFDTLRSFEYFENSDLESRPLKTFDN